MCVGERLSTCIIYSFRDAIWCNAISTFDDIFFAASFSPIDTSWLLFKSDMDIEHPFKATEYVIGALKSAITNGAQLFIFMCH